MNKMASEIRAPRAEETLADIRAEVESWRYSGKTANASDEDLVWDAAARGILAILDGAA